MVSKQVFKLGSRADGGVEAGSDNCMHPSLQYLGSQQLGEQQVHRHQQDLLRLHHQHLPRQHLTQGQVDRQAPGYRGLEDISHTRFSTMDGPGDWWYPPEDSSTHLTPPHHEVEAEVMAPPGDSIPQDRVSPDGSPLPTSHQLGVYDPRLFQDPAQPESSNVMPNFNAGFEFRDGDMLNLNIPESGADPSHPPRIRGLHNVRTNSTPSLADQLRYTIPAPAQGWVPPPGQTSYTHNTGEHVYLRRTVLEQFENEKKVVAEQIAEDEEDVEEEPINDENGAGIFRGLNLATMSSQELLQLREEHFGDYVCDSWVDPVTGEVYNADNLPPALFQLEPSARRPSRREAFELGFATGPDGVTSRKGPNGRAVLNLPYLPLHLSAGAPGWLLELHDRMDRQIEDSDYVARMNAEEFKLVQAINLAKKAEKAAEKSGKKLAKAVKKNLKPRDLSKKTFSNTLNMRRDREFRGPFGVIAWDPRSKKGDPSEKEVRAASQLSEDSIKYNTSLEVTTHGLQRVRLQGSYGEHRSKINMEGQFWPLEKFLTNGKLHDPSPRLQKLREVADELNQKLKQYGVNAWKNLPREERPASWFAKKDKAQARTANKRKAKDDAGADADSNGECEANRDVKRRKKAAIRHSKKARRVEIESPRSGHYIEHQAPYYQDTSELAGQPFNTDDQEVANEDYNWQGDSTAPGEGYVYPPYVPTTEANRHDAPEFHSAVATFRSGMIDDVIANLGGEHDATDPEFIDTIRGLVQVEWRARIANPESEQEEAILEALRAEFGN